MFPSGTPGFVLDVKARSALWEVGLDYRHGKEKIRVIHAMHDVKYMYYVSLSCIMYGVLKIVNDTCPMYYVLCVMYSKEIWNVCYILSEVQSFLGESKNNIR